MMWRFWEPEHVKLLRKSKALIKDPKRWCRKTYMYDTVANTWNQPDPMRLKEPTVQFCAQGSLLANSGHWFSGTGEFNDTPTGRAADALNTAARAHHAYGIVYVNDFLGHDAVMDVYDQAIKIAKKA